MSKDCNYVRTAMIAVINERPDFSIVQLGAFTGKSATDPIYNLLHKQRRRFWIGVPPPHPKVVLFEPIERYWRKLVYNYQQLPLVQCINAAISDSSG